MDKVSPDTLLARSPSTLESAYSMLIETYDASAQAHQTLGDKLLADIAQSLKVAEQQKEELRKKVSALSANNQFNELMTIALARKRLLFRRRCPIVTGSTAVA